MNNEKKEYIHELCDRTNNLYDIATLMLKDHPAVTLSNVEKEVDDVILSIQKLYNKIEIE